MSYDRSVIKCFAIVGDHQSSLEDSMASLELKPDHMKAIIRGMPLLCLYVLGGVSVSIYQAEGFSLFLTYMHIDIVLDGTLD